MSEKITLQDIIEIARVKSEILQNINDENCKYYDFIIDCKDISDSVINYWDDSKCSQLMLDLKKIIGPVVYYFEILSDNTPEQIIEALGEYRHDKNRERSIPAVKKNFPKESKVLYVGKAKHHFWGRVLQHLGHHNHKGSSGLQLDHWAKKIHLKLRLHAFEFDKNVYELTRIFENQVEEKLNPIIGKHSH